MDESQADNHREYEESEDESWTGAFGEVRPLSDTMVRKSFGTQAVDECYQPHPLSEAIANLQLSGLDGHVPLRGVHYGKEGRISALDFDRCEQDLMLPTSTLADVFLQSYTHLAEVHARGIAHRDLTPRNVLRKGTEVRFVDYGNATFWESRMAAPLEMTLNVCAYHVAAPELMDRTQWQYDATKADVWSLAYTLLWAARLLSPLKSLDEKSTPDQALARVKEACESHPMTRFCLEHIFVRDPARRLSAAAVVVRLGGVYIPLYPRVELPTTSERNLYRSIMDHAVELRNGVAEPLPSYVTPRVLSLIRKSRARGRPEDEIVIMGAFLLTQTFATEANYATALVWFREMMFEFPL